MRLPELGKVVIVGDTPEGPPPPSRAGQETTLFQRYFTEGYRFIPPYRSTFWCRLAGRVLPRRMPREFGVARWHFEGLDNLRSSLDCGAGILLAANHCRRADPAVLGMLGLHLRRYFYYVVSYHIFKQSRFAGWYLNRLGGYSIWREGADRDSLRATARILADAERPVVLFPEGTWFRQNDRLGPLQEGVSLIARQAVRQSARPVVVHPVAIKYWYLEDPRPALHAVLDARERSLGWSPQGHLDLLPRLEKLGDALLSLKEVEHFGHPRTGGLDERIAALADAHVSRLEKFYLGRVHVGHALERIRRLRQLLVRRLAGAAGDARQEHVTRQALDTLLFCENLSAQSHDYIRERPSLERLGETVQRIEETITDQAEAHLAPLGAVVAVGPALDARAFEAPARGTRREPCPLLGALRTGIQGLLDRLLGQGPPPEWGCPPPAETAAAPRPAAGGHPTEARAPAAGALAGAAGQR
jgi:hypothetical protein